MWLVYFKKHTKKSELTKSEAVQEALCYGWIDSVIRTIDDERYMQKFTPRKPNSMWSEVNKKKVSELIEKGLMQPSGQAPIDEAKASGEWERDRRTPEVVDPPKEFLVLLKQSPEAGVFWQNLTENQRKDFSLYMTTAKRAETRERRRYKVINMLTSKQLPSML